MMAMAAADLGRGGQSSSMDLRRALLLDGRMVLAGGPGLGSHISYLRNSDLASMAPQHVQPSAEFHHYPLQASFAGQYEEQHANNSYVDADVGVPGLMPPEASRASAGMVSAPSTLSPGLGFHCMDYLYRDVAGLEPTMQPYPHAYLNPNPNAGIVPPVEASLHSGGAQQGFLQLNSGIVPSLESMLKLQHFVGQQPLAGGFSAAGAVNHSQGNSLEDERRLAMIHEYGNGSVSHPQHPVPQFQAGYNHPGQVLPASVNQGSSHTQTYPWDLEMQRIRDIELQNSWTNHLDLQRPNHQYSQQQGKNLRHRLADNSFKIRKGTKFSKHFQKSAMKKKVKPPPVAGPGGPGWCNICQTDCNTADILQQHITGKRHQKKLQQLEKAEEKDTAETKHALENLKPVTTPEKDETLVQCKSESGLSEVMNHIETPGSSGKRNIVSVEELSVEPSAKKPRLLRRKGHSKEPHEPKIPPSIERCDICNVTCNNKLVLESHLSGKRHAAKVKKLQGEAQFNKGEGDQIKGEVLVEQNSVSVSETEKGINNSSADDLTILKDIAVLPTEPITLTKKDDE